MPILQNPRHERFAQELASGKAAIEAYEIAGYKRDGGNAVNLQKQDKVLHRVSELLDDRARAERASTQRAIERTAITKEQVALELGKIAFGNLSDFEDLNPKLADKRQALMDIARLFGWIIDKREQGKPGEFENLSVEEIDERLVAELVAGGISEKVARAFVRAEAGS